MRDLLVGMYIQRSKEMVIECEGCRLFRLTASCAWEGACGNFMGPEIGIQMFICIHTLKSTCVLGYFTAKEEPNSHGLNIDTEAKQSSQYVCAGERLQV